MEPDITPIKSDHEEEISLKDLILKTQDWGRYLLSKWKMIILLGLIGGGLGFLYASLKKPNYLAELSFVLEESKSSNLGNYAGIASQFGLDLGSAGGSGIFAGDNIIEFLKSRLMVEKTLLSPITLDGKEKSLADFYLEINNIKEKFDKDPALKNISFPVTTERKNFTLRQDSILNIIYTNLLKQSITVTKFDKKLSFISVKCLSRDQRFSKVFTERLVKEATDFYVQTKTKRAKANVDKLQEKVDSVEALLNKKTYSAAASQDLNLNPARSLAGVSTELVTRDKMVLQTMYVEFVKNLELSRMNMAQETPIIQIVDIPILPLKKVKYSRLMCLVAGGLIAGFLTLMWIIVRRIYKQIMSK
jgi:uncharacterized protein involved in exopolysaccharide biosynthesis